MKMNLTIILAALFAANAAATNAAAKVKSVQLGPRPFFLVEEMRDISLKDELMKCAAQTEEYYVSDFSIAHRGSPLLIPEHTVFSYKAASIMGAGIIECDVTFTKDLELVCRHAQCDLHYTTNVVTIPKMNEKCTTPWSPGKEPLCCASDFTLDEIKQLCAKMESNCDPANAETPEEYAFGCTQDWRTDLYANASCPFVMTHKEHIALGQELGAKFTPELKEPQVRMPFGSYTLDDYRSQVVEDLIEMGVPPTDVWLQSFVPEDVFWWIENYPEFGVQAVALDMIVFTNKEVDAWLDRLEENNVNIVAPPMSRLLEPDPSSEFLMKPSYYAKQAAARGFDIITWSHERTAPGLVGFFWNSLESVNDELTEGDRLTILHVLHDQVGVIGVFDDWPATTTFYANCMNLMLHNAGNGGRRITSQQDESEGEGYRGYDWPYNAADSESGNEVEGESQGEGDSDYDWPYNPAESGEIEYDRESQGEGYRGDGWYNAADSESGNEVEGNNTYAGSRPPITEEP